VPVPAIAKGFGINPEANGRIAGSNQFSEYQASLVFSIDHLKMAPSKGRLLGRPLRPQQMGIFLLFGHGS